MRITMSICIPTYNGEDTIAQTLESIISQRISNFEIVLNDDNSFDSTVEVIKKYLKKYKFIKLFTNKSNIGMDQNLTKTVLQAKGKFIWLCGQDDNFEKGALKKFNQIIQKYKSLDFIYFNYRFWDDNFKKELKPPQLTIEQDLFFKNSASYFKKIDHVPSFLPATVMKRVHWHKVDFKQFWGSHYVQMGVWLSNFQNGKTYVVSSPDYISCRIPSDSWKNKNGQMLFEIFLGTLEVYYNVNEINNKIIPKKIIKNMHEQFFWNLPSLIVFLSEKGLKLNIELKKRVKNLFKKNYLKYWFWVFPWLNMPKFFIEKLVLLYSIKLIKNIIKLFKSHGL